jgi:hypothetical protein
MRYFRTSSADLYESVRLQLDAAWGHPNAATGTVTCIAPAAMAPRDREGRIVLAVRDEFATWEPASTVLPQLLAGGLVDEITAAQYAAGTYPEQPERTSPQPSPSDFNVVPGWPVRLR